MSSLVQAIDHGDREMGLEVVVLLVLKRAA